MIAFSEYSVDEVFSAMNVPGKTRFAFLPDGTKFKCRSDRLVLFRDKGIYCITCGIAGSVFVLETHSLDISPHLNLYAVKENGEKVLMTKDHIMPKSKGGSNTLENYQPMCTVCNSKKADKF